MLIRGDFLKESRIFLKSFMVVIVFLLTITTFLPGEVYSAGSDADIEMEVQAGFDGVARLGAYIPYRILLVNKGRAVEGEVQIEIKIDSNSKTVFAKPVSLAEGAVKEVVIEAPVFTARRGIQVKFQEDGKTIKEMEYTFTKLIPPDMKTIGVLSSDNAAYNFLNGLKISLLDSEIYEKEIITKAAGVLYSSSSTVMVNVFDEDSLAKVDSILIPLTGENLPEDIKSMNNFDILILSNFDTGTLSEDQLSTLEEWVEEGGTLVIGTGTNWKKVYNSLPDTLKKFSILDTTSIEPPQELEEFSGKNFKSKTNLDMVNGSIGFEYIEKVDADDEKNKGSEDEEKQKLAYSADINEVIIGDGDRPLAVKYIHKSGRILFLTFDPGMEPVESWDGKQSFWENLLFHSSNMARIYDEGAGYYYSNYDDNYYFNSLAEQVPEDKKPPFWFMFITIAVYIIIAGPAMYIFLKKKDKRDFNWVAVPAVSLMCLLIIFMVGFKTRYRTAVLNTVSLINLDMKNQNADITTGMGIFNNKKGDIKLTYSQKDNIDFDISQSDSRDYVTYANGKEPEGKVVSKLELTEPANYKLYDVSMWEAKYLTAKKSESFQDELINSVQFNNGRFKAVINNTTQYDFIDTFITIGSNFIGVGDILSGQEKEIEADFNSENVYKNFDTYLDAKYGRTSYPSNMKPPADFYEKRRKRIVIDRLLESKYSSIKGQTKIGLYALNYQNLGYDIKINDEQPVLYSTNSIFSSMDINFEKGSEMDIPSGIILPEMAEYGIAQNVARLDSDNGVRIKKKGDIDFIYTLPDGIQPTQFSLKFDTYIPIYVKYDIEEMKSQNKNLQTRILQNQYEYYLYNKTLDTWEQIEESHNQTNDVGSYFDEENKLKVRVKVVEMADTDTEFDDEYVESERLAFPGLQLKGVVQ